MNNYEIQSKQFKTAEEIEIINLKNLETAIRFLDDEEFDELDQYDKLKIKSLYNQYQSINDRLGFSDDREEWEELDTAKLEILYKVIEILKLN